MTRHAAQPRPASLARRGWRWLRERGPVWWAKVLGPPTAYLALALYLSSRLAADPQGRLFPGSQGADQVGAQWFLAHSAYAVAHFTDPFVTGRLNAPVGVNLAAQVTMVGVGVPLAPVTLLFGVAVTYLVLLLLSLAGTATAWYWLLAAKLRRRFPAAAVGGLFCGFSPQFIADATGRNHITLQILIPVIAWQACRLGSATHPARRGVVLGLLVAWQALIGEEVLLLTALGLAVFSAAYLAQRPRLIRLAGRYAAGLGVAALVAGALLAYPLWRQFLGPGNVHGFPLNLQVYTNYVVGYLGMPAGWAALLPGPLASVSWWAVTDLVTLGLPLVVLLAGTVAAQWRDPVVPALGAVVLVFAVLSQGATIHLGPHGDVPGPWRLVNRLPVFEVVVPFRLSLVAAVGAGLLLAYAVDGTIALVARQVRAPRHTRWRPLAAAGTAALVLVVAALLGLSAIQVRPHRLATVQATPIPRFIASGAWRPYVRGGYSLVSVPVAASNHLDGQRWSAATTIGYATPGGYFIGPGTGRDDVRFSPPATWTTALLDTVARTGQVPRLGAPERARLLADLRWWHAGLLVLGPDQANHAALQQTLDQLLGPGRPVQDVTLWDVRGRYP